MTRRIGIYAGTFDPLHTGHISFAIAAANKANLEQVYFLPERSPRFKPYASPYTERLTFVRQTITPHSSLEVFELPDDALSVQRTLPELQSSFPESQIVLLVGSDVVTHMHTWPEISQLVSVCDFVVGMRTGANEATVRKALHALGVADTRLTIVRTDQAHLSSTAIRQSSP